MVEWSESRFIRSNESSVLIDAFYSPINAAQCSEGIACMRVVFQRVKHASVHIEGEEVAAIGPGALVLLGIGEEDSSAEVQKLARRVAHLRVFSDDEGKMNQALTDTGGACIVVSQFTLYGDCSKGRRPSFVRARAPDEAKALYLEFVDALRTYNIPVQTGRFGADMQLSLCNDGPVTMLLDTEKRF